MTEWKWEPDDVDHAGCYELLIGWRLDLLGMDPRPPTGSKFFKGWRYLLALQARTFDHHRPPRVVDQGQTLVDVISVGE